MYGDNSQSLLIGPNDPKPQRLPQKPSRLSHPGRSKNTPAHQEAGRGACHARTGPVELSQPLSSGQRRGLPGAQRGFQPHQEIREYQRHGLPLRSVRRYRLPLDHGNEEEDAQADRPEPVRIAAHRPVQFARRGAKPLYPLAFCFLEKVAPANSSSSHGVRATGRIPGPGSSPSSGSFTPTNAAETGTSGSRRTCSINRWKDSPSSPGSRPCRPTCLGS